MTKPRKRSSSSANPSPVPAAAAATGARARPPVFRSGVLPCIVAPAVTLLLALLIAMKVEWMNGAPYWRWSWRDLSLLRTLPVIGAGLLPLILGHWLFARRPERPYPALACVTLTAMLLQFLLLGVATNPFSLERMAGIVRSPDATSYFNDAQALAKHPDLLASYDELLPRLHGHTRTKPPGLLVFYRTMQQAFPDPQTAATAAGILIALITGLGVVSVYIFARIFDASPAAAFFSASLFALAPSLHLFFPMFDACYPQFCMALFASWLLALRRDAYLWSALFGVVLAAACFFAYNLLVVGVGLGALSLRHMLEPPKRPLARVALHALVALGTFAAVNALLFLLTGFDAAATLMAALENQRRILGTVDRPYPATIWFDLTEFAQGAGYIPVFLSFQYLLLRQAAADEVRRGFVFIFLCQILAVALSAALPGETERVWLFLLPLLVYGAGLELSRWPATWRAFALASVVAVLVAVHANMAFV